MTIVCSFAGFPGGTWQTVHLPLEQFELPAAAARASAAFDVKSSVAHALAENASTAHTESRGCMFLPFHDCIRKKRNRSGHRLQRDPAGAGAR
jgi:hypothetical protein